MTCELLSGIAAIAFMFIGLCTIVDLMERGFKDFNEGDVYMLLLGGLLLLISIFFS